MRIFRLASTTLPHISHPAQMGEHGNGARWYFLTDGCAFLIAFVFSWCAAAYANGTIGRYALFTPFQDYGIAGCLQFPLIMTGCLWWFYSSGHYRNRMPFWLEAKRVILAVSLTVMANCVLLFVAKQDFSRLWLTLNWLLCIAFILAMRTDVRRYARKRGCWEIPALLVGGGETAHNTLDALRSECSMGYHVIRQITDLPAAFLRAGRSWHSLCVQHGARYVILALDGEEVIHARQPIAQLMRESVPFSVSPPFSQLPVMDMATNYIISHDVMLLTPGRGQNRIVPRLLKRSGDIVVAGSLLVLLSPVLLWLAARIGSDGGAVLYRQTRIGKNGVAFSCFKFRSMRMDGDACLAAHLKANPSAKKEWDATCKLKDDPRITPVGTFIRRYSLDELPQLVNVIKGEMSLVGPRPIVAGEIDRYEGDIAYYKCVRPGLTGLWQVSGRNAISYEKRVHMDSWYVRNWSLWHDMAILCKTVPALISQKGAY